VLIWNEAPAVRQFCAAWRRQACSSGHPGKAGRAGWPWDTCSPKRRPTTSRSSTPTLSISTARCSRRLVLPALDPIVDFDFVKAYYSRYSDRLHGRLTRLYLSPLAGRLHPLIGQDPYIRYLSSFRTRGRGVSPCSATWRPACACRPTGGSRIVTLFEALRHRAPVRVCQVEIADHYEHKHQGLSSTDPTAA